MAKLEPIPELYDTPYTDDLKDSLWRAEFMGHKIRVVGEGTKPGTAHVRTLEEQYIEQDDMPVWTLNHNYTRLHARYED